jgi:GalNAc-alpha-(1->4)-GalNAc-alpha-(1->3)-diNAcBac-PP-undecaprenol alpha-1,4-N-acetyl-D-galactosaminyltransferase
MKITCVIHSLNGGGAERVMAGLSSRLQAKGHLVTLITLDDGQNDRHEVDSRVTRRPLAVMRQSETKLAALLNSLRRIKVVRQAIRGSKPDVVLSFCDATNVLTLIATRGLACPVVVSERSDPQKQSLSWPWSKLRPRLYRHADDVIVLTKTAADAVAPWCRKPPAIIPSAVDQPPIFHRSQHGHRSERVLLAIGRLEQEKGFDRLIEAFAQVAPHYPTWQLRIAGEGACREHLQQQADSLGLSKRVTFDGWVRPIWPALENADLFVLTSRYEGFPSALLEAMAAGVAAIAVDCESGPRAIIDDNIDGLLVENNIPSIVAALERCMGNESLRNRLGDAGRNIIERFGWDAMVDAYEQRLLTSIAKR